MFQPFLVLNSRNLAWIVSLPYASLLSKLIVTPKEVAISYSSIPISSILGPIFTGKSFLIDI